MAPEPAADGVTADRTTAAGFGFFSA